MLIRSTEQGQARFSRRTSSIEEARVWAAEDTRYPSRLDVLGDRTRFAYQIDVVYEGAISIGWWSYETEVQLEVTARESAYHVNVPTSRLLTSLGPDRIAATPAQAVVYRTDDDSLVPQVWRQQGRIHAVTIDGKALERQLEFLLGRRPSSRIAFEPLLDLTRGRGWQWWILVQTLAAQLNDADSLPRHPLMTAPMTDSITTGLLLATSHPYREELDTPATPARHLAVRRAMDHVESCPELPLTVGDIAAAAGVSIRALQQGFQTAVGVEPMRYLREVRLARVRQDLLRADTDEAGVAEIAFRWGFAHLGRFARRYREMYGETPSETLRR
jgi:AraC-like DNA-binding protein